MGYWTDKRLVYTNKKIVYNATSGDGHSFNDSYEEEVIETPIYASRLGDLIRFIIGTGIILSASYGIYTSIESKIKREERISDNKCLIHKVEQIGWGNDYHRTDEEGRKLIEAFEISYPVKKGKEHLIRFYPTETGANWNLASTNWEKEMLGEIPSEKLREYIEQNQ